MTIKRNFIRKISEHITQHSVQMDVFPLIAVLINIIFVIIYVNEYPLLNQDILSLVASTACIYVLISIIIYFIIPQVRYRLFPLIWLIGIFLALGFLPSYAVFITNGKKYLVLNLSSSLLLLSIVVDWAFFMSISVIGVISAYLFFLCTGVYEINYSHPSKKLYMLSYIISYML
jgi:hypothetical protein